MEASAWILAAMVWLLFALETELGCSLTLGRGSSGLHPSPNPRHPSHFLNGLFKVETP